MSGHKNYIRTESHVIFSVDGMSRMIRSDNSLFSLQMRCFYISNEYKGFQKAPGTEYIKDIFDDG
jgi:hypothetical protein